VQQPNEEGALIDISVAYSADTPVWPGDTPFSCGWIARREDGSSVNIGRVTTSIHAGTHADAPLHVESTWAGSEALPARVFVGEACVIALPHDMPSDAEITRDVLASLIGADGPRSPLRLLCRTGHSVSRGAFPDAWPVLSADAAAWLVESGLLLWGTDAPSVDSRLSRSLPVHHALFGAGAFVLENLSLQGVAPGHYELLAQPLAICGADAAPVRAMLRPIMRVETVIESKIETAASG